MEKVGFSLITLFTLLDLAMPEGGDLWTFPFRGPLNNNNKKGYCFSLSLISVLEPSKSLPPQTTHLSL